MLTTKLVTTDRELEQIADLSKANLVSNLSAETRSKEGFVTWVYTPETLKALGKIIPSVIVKDGDTLAGYALSLSPACTDVYPPMAATHDLVSSLSYNGRPLAQQKVYYCGQICIAEAYRGQGVVNMLYQFHRQQFSPQFDLLVTEISTANPRSLKAHQKVGFQVIETHRDELDQWDIVLWDWKKQAGQNR
jgi:RimJ/RimL family protein N-acetyltransferase